MESCAGMGAYRRALEEALAAGQTKSIGVSHFLEKDLAALMTTANTKPVCATVCLVYVPRLRA